MLQKTASVRKSTVKRMPRVHEMLPFTANSSCFLSLINDSSFTSCLLEAFKRAQLKSYLLVDWSNMSGNTSFDIGLLVGGLI